MRINRLVIDVDLYTIVLSYTDGPAANRILGKLCILAYEKV